MTFVDVPESLEKKASLLSWMRSTNDAERRVWFSNGARLADSINKSVLVRAGRDMRTRARGAALRCGLACDARLREGARSVGLAGRWHARGGGGASSRRSGRKYRVGVQACAGFSLTKWFRNNWARHKGAIERARTNCVARIMATELAAPVAPQVEPNKVLLTPDAAKEFTKLRQREKDDQNKNRKYSTEKRFLSQTIFTWNGTIAPKVFFKADVWVATLVHVALFVVDQLYREGVFDATTATPFVRHGCFFTRYNISVEFKYMGQTIWMMVFTLTFFVGQCYARYLNYAGWCAGMGGKLMEISQKLAVDLETLPDDRWDVVRFLTSSVLLVFGDTQRGKGAAAIHKELFWKRLTNPEAEFLGHIIKTADGLEVPCQPLLTDAEVTELKKFNGNRGMLLQTWAIKAASTGYEKIGVTRTSLPIRDDIHAIRQNGAGILNTLALVRPPISTFQHLGVAPPTLCLCLRPPISTFRRHALPILAALPFWLTTRGAAPCAAARAVCILPHAGGDFRLQLRPPRFRIPHDGLVPLAPLHAHHRLDALGRARARMRAGNHTPTFARTPNPHPHPNPPRMRADTRAPIPHLDTRPMLYAPSSCL